MDNIENIFPFWNKLKESEKNTITNSIKKEKYSKGMIINKTENTCKGLLAVLSGQLRVYILSEEGREITLFRVKQGEICVLSASCLMDSITFDTLIEAAGDEADSNVQTGMEESITNSQNARQEYLDSLATPVTTTN